jgi:hypothetical protein
VSCGGSFANCETWRYVIDVEENEATHDEDNVVVEGFALVVMRERVWFRRELIPEAFVGDGVDCSAPKTGML